VLSRGGLPASLALTAWLTPRRLSYPASGRGRRGVISIESEVTVHMRHGRWNSWREVGEGGVVVAAGTRAGNEGETREARPMPRRRRKAPFYACQRRRSAHAAVMRRPHAGPSGPGCDRVLRPIGRCSKTFAVATIVHGEWRGPARRSGRRSASCLPDPAN
jgi:hypothetical protein